MGQNDPENLLFETSPYGNLDAIVEQDGRAVFFYLSGQGREGDRFGTRACWVRNLLPGPYVINEDEMKQGLPPALPRTHCKYSDGRAAPVADQLVVIWFEEGNGVALVENSPDGSSRTLAIIPPWSGIDGFHGYADECAAESPICWPMPDQPQLRERINRAREFWQSCQSTDEHPFPELQKQILAAYRSAWDRETNYFAIDGGKFPPRGLATFETEDRMIAATVGMSLCPQPIVEMQVEHPRDRRRIELAIELPSDIPAEAKNQILQQIGGLAAMPWHRWAWLGPSHTCGFNSLAAALGDEFQNVRIQQNVADSKLTTPSLADFRNDPVNLLWLVPFAGQVSAG